MRLSLFACIAADVDFYDIVKVSESMDKLADMRAIINKSISVIEKCTFAELFDL